MLEGVQVLKHSSIRIEKDKVIYFDPYEIDEEMHDADLIFITHSHYDHFSYEDICKVMKKETKMILPITLKREVFPVPMDQCIFLLPKEKTVVDGVTVEAIPAYNNKKRFHPALNKWLGYVITFGGYTYYIAGDTDKTIDNQDIHADVAFLPIGGTFTMGPKEAAELAKDIHPSVVVPIHYGLIVGTPEDAEEFKRLVSDEMTCEILMK